MLFWHSSIPLVYLTHSKLCLTVLLHGLWKGGFTLTQPWDNCEILAGTYGVNCGMWQAPHKMGRIFSFLYGKPSADLPSSRWPWSCLMIRGNPTLSSDRGWEQWKPVSHRVIVNAVLMGRVTNVFTLFLWKFCSTLGHDLSSPVARYPFSNKPSVKVQSSVAL